MADVIHVAQGCQPWQPAPDAALIEVYDEYDVPTIGIVEQQGVRYLFVNLAGAGVGIAPWIYALVDDAQTRMLEAATDDDFERVMSEIVGQQHLVAVIAEEDAGILVATHVEPIGSDDLREVISIVLSGLKDALQQLNDGLAKAQEQLTPA